MRGVVFVIVFFSLLPMVFKKPYVGVLLWYWISLMNPHRLTYGFASSIPFALLVAVVTFASVLFMHPEEPKTPPRDRTTFLLVALMIWISITSLVGRGVPADILTVWAEPEKMLLMTIVAYTLTNTRERFDQLVLVCVLSIAFFGFKGGVFSLLHGGSFRVYGPPNSKIADNNDIGCALSMIVPLLFYLGQRYTNPHLKWPLRALIGFTIIGALFTYSRAAMLAIGAMMSVLWLRTRHKVAIGLAVVVTLVGVLQFAPESWFNRLQTIENYQQDGSAQSRLFMWQLAWAMALKHPITGAGFNWSYNENWVNRELAGTGVPLMVRPKAVHSMWFKMVSMHGFIGLALFISFFVLLGMNAQWVIRRTRGRSDLAWANNFARMLQASLVGFSVGGRFCYFVLFCGFFFFFFFYFF